jgi:NAD(P)-dependent dehydrogenase (short-subunit alcohol dehydrogenase family)
MRLKGKLVVVTAAASGMGRAGVELFLREGARVAAVDIDGTALTRLADDLRDRGGTVETVQADLSQPGEVRRSINDAARLLGGIDVLWAHAGTPGPGGVENLELAAYQKAVDLNLTSAILSAGEAVAHMRKRGGGSIIFTASVSGLVGSMFSPVYSAAKFAIVGLAKSLALRFASDGVRVNVVCPGLADTPMRAGFTGRSGDPAEEEANLARYLTMVPLGRLCRADEAAHAVLWLASDDASFVTGVALPVDGGYTAR